MVTKSPLDGLGLTGVVEYGTSAVGVDHINILGAQLGVLQRTVDGTRGPVTFWVGRGNVVGITG